MTATSNYKEPNVFLVGAGPGDPGLIAVRAVECLKRAHVVIYDYLADPQLLAYVPRGVEMIYVGKKAGRHTLRQEGINSLLVEKGASGRIVVRLKGGDPFVFGRGGEEGKALHRAGIPFEVVPGITAGISVPCYAGIPVTHRGVSSSMAFITGHEDSAKAESSIHWEHLAQAVDTLIFYMGVGNLPSIVERLIRNGRDPQTPVAVIRWGTKPRQQTVTGTLRTIADVVKREGIGPPAITVVGEVVGLREGLRWFEQRPLFGKSIVNTRSRSQASALTTRLAALGAEVVELPTIEIVPAGEDSDLGDLVKSTMDYDWILFTSPNGVHAFFDLLLKAQGDVRALGRACIGSIGPGTTAAIEAYHVKPTVTAGKAVAEGLMEALRPMGPWESRHVLLPRAEKARDVLPDALRRWGAQVEVVTAYRTVAPTTTDPDLLERVKTGTYDLITFSSSSTVHNFVALLGEGGLAALAAPLKAASIGPVTSATLRDYGVEPLVEAPRHTIPGLTQALLEYLAT